MRLTKTRKLVFNIFKENKNLLCAEDINQLLINEKIDLSTIYRALEYFVSENVIEKSTVNKTAYYYLKEGDHHHFMICKNCLKRIPISCSFEQTFKKSIAETNFIVTSHDLTVYGFCADCQKLVSCS